MLFGALGPSAAGSKVLVAIRCLRASVIGYQTAKLHCTCLSSKQFEVNWTGMFTCTLKDQFAFLLLFFVHVPEPIPENPT